LEYNFIIDLTLRFDGSNQFAHAGMLSAAMKIRLEIQEMGRLDSLMSISNPKSRENSGERKRSNEDVEKGGLSQLFSVINMQS
jgi:hypothetical protein